MTRQRIRQWLVAIKATSDHFFGVEAPEDETQPSPEYVRGWQTGYLVGAGEVDGLLRIIQRIAKGQD